MARFLKILIAQVLITTLTLLASAIWYNVIRCPFSTFAFHFGSCCMIWELMVQKASYLTFPKTVK